MKSLSRVQLFAIPWTVACQAPLSMGFSRQGYKSGLPFSSPGDLPDPGIEPGSPALHADSLLSEPPGKLPNKAKVDVFPKLSCVFDDPADVGNLISGSAFSKFRLNTWKFMIHVLLKRGLVNFEYYFASVWDECNWAVVWAFFGIAFLMDWNENWPFPVLWPLLSFLNLLAYWVKHFHSIIF